MKFNKLKYQSIVIVLIIITAIMWNEYSYIKETDFSSDSNSAEFLKKIPGTLKLKVIDGKKSKTYVVKDGAFHLKQRLPFPPSYLEQRPYNYWFMEEKGLRGANVEGYNYHGPYSLNNEKSFAIFSLSPKKAKDSPRSLILVNWHTKDIITKSDLDGSIEDIFWSPDSKMFAILESVNAGHPVSILATISALSGHPQCLYLFYISFYDEKGNLLNKSKISNKVLINKVQLFWE
jgi:hypothetical protein